VGALLGLAQLEARAAGDHLAAVVQKDDERVAQVQQLGLVPVDGQQVDPEAGLQVGVLVQVVQDDRRLDVAAQLDDDAHPLAVALVAKVGDSVHLAVLDQVGDLLDELALVHLVRDFGDHQRLTALGELLDGHPRPQLEDAATGAVRLADPRPAVDERGGGEVGSGDERHQFVDGGLGVFDEMDQGVDHLAQIVGRDVGGHAHGDARRAVDQQVGQFRWQHQRFGQGLVVVGAEVDRFLLDVGEHLLRQPRHPDFGVAHGRGGVAVDGAEIPLAVHQRAAHGEVLLHADDGVIDGHVAVGMVLADHVADDAGALLVRLRVGVAQLVHGVEDAPVDRLEAVAGVGERAADDDRHGVVEVRLLDFVLDVDLDEVFEGELVLLFHGDDSFEFEPFGLRL